MIAKFSLEEFREAFSLWLVNLQDVTDNDVVVVDANGNPIHMLNVFIHDFGLAERLAMLRDSA